MVTYYQLFRLGGIGSEILNAGSGGKGEHEHGAMGKDSAQSSHGADQQTGSLQRVRCSLADAGEDAGS